MFIWVRDWIRPAIIAISLLASSSYVRAQLPEGSTVRLVNPGSPGGTVDMVTRTLAERLSNTLKRSAIVENKPGASGAIAADTVSRASADGTTLLVGVDSIFVTNPHIFKTKKLEGPGLKPLLMLGSFPIALVVHEGVPAKTVSEFLQYAKKRPGELTYASLGVGSTHHLVAEALFAEAGIKLRHVPYKGVDGMALGFLGGRLSVGFFSLASAEKLVKSGGGNQILAITGTTRARTLPNVPSMVELYPRLTIDSWVGVFVPQATASSVTNEMKAAIVANMNEPGVVERLRENGFIASIVETEPFARRILGELAARGDLIQRLGIAGQ